MSTKKDSTTTAEDVVEEQATEEQTASAVEESYNGPLIYMGPNLPGGRLLQSTVFRGGVPAYLQSLLTEQPNVTALIVPVSEMAAVQANIIKTGTPEYVAYQALIGGGASGV